jgi:hypothetical protein
MQKNLEMNNEALLSPHRSGHCLNTHRSCGGMTYKTFIEQLIRDLILLSYDQNITASGTAHGRPSPAAT